MADVDLDELKKRLAEYSERDKERRDAKKEGRPFAKEPYGEELEPEPKIVPKPKPKPRPKPKVQEEVEDLDRFSGDYVNLTQEEFNILMKHADVGQQAIQAGMVQEMPQQPRRVQRQEMPDAPAPMSEHQPTYDQELPDGSFERIEPPKRGRFFNRGGGHSYVLEDRVTTNPTILYYDTDNTCKLITGKLSRDGSLQVDDRLFDFSEGVPSILNIKRGKGRSSSHPFYILRYDNMKPIDINDYPDSNPTPEQASRLIELKTLQTLTQIEGGKMRKGPLIILMLASFFGGFAIHMVLSLAGILG